MTEFRDYKRYTTDPEWAQQYSNYQKRYALNPRESDKELAAWVKRAVDEFHPRLSRRPRILDIGCSTGNLLRLLKQVIPYADLFGGDLMAPIVEECRNAPDLIGMDFQVMDVFDIPKDRPFDVIVGNAVTYLFDQEQYARALASIYEALIPDGFYIGYELVFPGDKEEVVVEKSQGHPEGLRLILRSGTNTRKALAGAGFERVTITRFEIPIDLPKPEITGTDADLATYTVIDPVTNQRLMYRGVLYQPWAHLKAHKPIGL